ncbi:MAG TPA: SIS domain-containing protein [Baekduia sp.]|nr:SIS domain-containing protein [Baekduia sp.]
MNPDGFLDDVLREPETLARVLDAHDRDDARLSALAARMRAARLVVLTGMGSSRFAALTAAAALRERGIPAVAEHASTEAPAAAGRDVLAIGISASGGSEETVEALGRHHGIGPTVAITNTADGGRLAAVADEHLPLHAGAERGGVACASFQATLALLLRLAGVPTGVLAAAPQLQGALLGSRDAWLDELLSLLDDASAAPAVYTIAPAARISSALQSALMLREGPRVAADGTETGDWAHVDVYLSKHSGYRAILFSGSRYDGGVMEWAQPRAASIVAIGAPVEGAAMHLPIAGPGTPVDPLTAALVEVSVVELVAATWWRRRLDAGRMP